MEKEGKGFTVSDRRHSSVQSVGTEPPKTVPPSKSGPAGSSETHSAPDREFQEFPLPEVDFSTLILSMSSSAIIHFGDYVDPKSGKTERNLPLAKHTIDMLGMLQEKTRGNVTPDEARLLENVLYNLRLRYLEAVREIK